MVLAAKALAAKAIEAAMVRKPTAAQVAEVGPVLLG
jgi:hypothetical protein